MHPESSYLPSRVFHYCLRMGDKGFQLSSHPTFAENSFEESCVPVLQLSLSLQRKILQSVIKSMNTIIVILYP